MYFFTEKTCLESDGLPENENLVIKRTKTCLSLLERFKIYKSILVSSPPFRGKSCLYQLLKMDELKEIAKRDIDFEYETLAISFARFEGISTII